MKKILGKRERIESYYAEEETEARESRTPGRGPRLQWIRPNSGRVRKESVD